MCYLPLQVLGSYEFALSVFPAAWSSPCIVCLYFKKKTSSAAPRRGDTRYLGTREWGLSLSTPTGSSKPSNTEQGVWPCLSYSWTAGEDVTQPGMDKKKKEREKTPVMHISRSSHSGPSVAYHVKTYLNAPFSNMHSNEKS